MAIRISQVAAQAGLNAHTVRYYEQAGLLPEPERSPTGYRLYGDEAAERLRFIKGARRLGLHVKDVRELLAVRDRGLCPCGHAEAIVRKRLVEVEAELERLAELRRELSRLLTLHPAESCPDPQAVAWLCGENFIRAGGDAGDRASVPANT